MFIDFVYIIDIIVAILYLGHVGRRNGIQAEFYFMMSGIISGFAAYLNHFRFGKSLEYVLPSLPAELVGFVSFVIFFVMVRGLLAYVGLQLTAILRNPSFEKNLREYGGAAFAIIKAVYLVSATLFAIHYLSPLFPALTDPLTNNSLVIFFSQILGSSYDIVFSILPN